MNVVNFVFIVGISLFNIYNMIVLIDFEFLDNGYVII